MKNILAFDFGASSGRAILGSFDGTKIKLTEIHRFSNDPVMLNNTFYWDFLRLFYEIKQGLAKAKLHGEFSSIAFDTWGVDFGLIDEKGNLLQNPVHYRDLRTKGLVEEVCDKIGKDKIYNITGTQFMELNTLYQLYALKKYSPETLEKAKSLLLMPDLFAYFLCGVKNAEYSIASTTQMYDHKLKDYSKEILNELGIDTSILPKVSSSGKILGKISKEIKEELNLGDIDVISACGHDTACAVVSVPAQEEDYIYVSCGTWSLVGTELQTPFIGDKSLEYNITNEGGYGGKIRFLKNLSGLWLINETRRQFIKEGKEYSFGEITKLANESKPFQFFIDPDYDEFAVPGNLPKKIKDFCVKTGQGEPKTDGDIFRCIYESIALNYKYTIDEISECTKKEYPNIYMVGGGIQAEILCQMAAGATGATVTAGPIEATVLGNIAVQLIALGEIKDISEARKVIENSTDVQKYTPKDLKEWNEAYLKFSNNIK